MSTPSPESVCGHDNCRKPRKDHIELTSANGSESELLCPYFVTAANSSQTFEPSAVPVQEPTRIEMNRQFDMALRLFKEHCDRASIKYYLESNSITGTFNTALREIFDDAYNLHRADLLREVTTLKEMCKEQGELILNQVLTISELQAEVERLKKEIKNMEADKSDGTNAISNEWAV